MLTPKKIQILTLDPPYTLKICYQLISCVSTKVIAIHRRSSKVWLVCFDPITPSLQLFPEGYRGRGIKLSVNGLGCTPQGGGNGG